MANVSREMRKRLATNRHGKLTSDQWKEMVMEPVITLLLLTVPALFILGPRILMVGRFVGWIGLLALVLFVVPVLFRAYRYARKPVYFEVLKAGSHTASSWKLWKPTVLEKQSGEVLRFTKRLAPRTLLARGETYLVYYLKDAGNCVLLSIAPADHPDAEKWQPSADFKQRLEQRGGRRSAESVNTSGGP